MSVQTQELRTFIYMEELKETPLIHGGVFSVVAQPIFNKQHSVRTIEIRLVDREGHGDIWQHIILNDRKTSIPEQVELLLLEIECLPTWFWHQANGRYYGQFAHKTNHKCADVFSAEDKGFPVLL